MQELNHGSFGKLPSTSDTLASLQSELARHEWVETLLELQTDILELIAANKPMRFVLDEITRAMESIRSNMSASILLLDGQLLRHGSAPSLPDEFNRAIEGVQIGPNVGSCGTAAYLNQMIIVSDIAVDHYWSEYRDLALKFGLRACWSMPIRDPNGQVSGTFAMYYREVQAPNERDLELIQLASHLASIAIEGERRQREMQEATAKLEENIARRNHFLAVLSHELRNPLAVIVTGSNLLDSADCVTSELRPIVGALSRQSRHMGQILDDLLDASRLTHNKFKLNRQPTDICQLVRQVCQDWKEVLREGRCHMTMSMPQSPIWCDLDGVRLAQCLANLINNARKYSSAVCHIEVELRLQDRHKTVEIVVRDKGLGMTPDAVERIFKPFESGRSHPGRPQGMGLGLGLYIVRGIVELHGGSVRATSPGPGLGSTFIISLPIVEPVLQPQTFSERVDVGAISPRRVLVIEDSPDLSMLTKLILQHAGHEVFTAENGAEGIRLAQEIIPDVVLCDIGLGGEMDGYEVAATLRADKFLSRAYVVALTGYGQESDRLTARGAGFSFHLTKPVGREKLLEVVQKMPHFK